MSQSRNATYHVNEQWRVRADRDAASVITAWDRGLRVEVPAEAPVPPHDEARYDARGGAVVFRRSNDLITCYGLDAEHVTNIHGVAVAAAVDAQFGTSYCSRIDPRNLEDTNQ